MKIAILIQHSYPSLEGGWNRVYNEAIRLVKKGHEVHVLSNNIIKGSNKTSSLYELYQNIHIHRFPVKYEFLGIYFWDFEKKLKQINPDIINTHGYRQPYSNKALKIAKELNIPCFLTTHAPFLPHGIRNPITQFIADFFDLFLGKKTLNQYKKVIAISKWEIPLLRKIGCKKENIVYIPNGADKEYFKKSNIKKLKNTFFFFGRIALIKNLECLILASKILSNKNKNFKVIIRGVPELPYLKKLKDLTLKLKLENFIEFKPPIIDLKDKVKAMQLADVFILPSHREAIPQSLIEAMASSTLVISSKTAGGLELVNQETGFLFNISNHKELAKIMELTLKNNYKEKRIKARKFAKQFLWDSLVEKLLRTYN